MRATEKIRVFFKVTTCIFQFIRIVEYSKYSEKYEAEMKITYDCTIE